MCERSQVSQRVSTTHAKSLASPRCLGLCSWATAYTLWADPGHGVGFLRATREPTAGARGKGVRPLRRPRFFLGSGSGAGTELGTGAGRRLGQSLPRGGAESHAFRGLWKRVARMGWRGRDGDDAASPRALDVYSSELIDDTEATHAMHRRQQNGELLFSEPDGTPSSSTSACAL